MNNSRQVLLIAKSSAGHGLAEAGQSREQLEFWINCVGAPLVVVDKKSLIARSANRSATTFFGRDANSIADCPMDLLVGPEAGQLLAQIWSVAPVGIPGEPFLLNAVVQGQNRSLMVQVSQLLVDNEQMRLFTFQDAPPQGTVALAGWQENIIAMLNWLPFGFEIASTDEQVQFVNSQFHQMFGYPPHELENIENWWSLAYPDPAYRQYARNKWETETTLARAENREMTPFDLEVITKDGQRRTIQFRHRTIGAFNVNLYLDVTRERAYAQELKTLADTDPLTGAMNRRRFFKKAGELCAFVGLPPVQVAVLMLDIDNFKHINDLHGHGTGDRVLQEFTHRCRLAIRKNDLFARLGGEEFAVLLNGATLSEISEIGERVRANIAAHPFEVGDINIDVTVSVGGACRLPGEDKIDDVLARADRALYQAKDAGRNRLVISETA